MGITVHYNDTPFQLPSSPDGPSVNSTYAQGTQRLVEQKLLSRQLLPLLSSLASSSSSSAAAAAAGVVGSRYKLRFGDGYATIIHVIRSDTSNSTSRTDVIEANISLKPRDTLSDDEDNIIDPSDWMPTSQSLDGSSSDTRHVDLVVEKIGFVVVQQQQQQQRNGSGLLRGRLGNGNLVPMTQSPFPVDEKKINLLCVWEHPEFEGYVDSYTLDRWSSVSKDEEGVNGGGDRAKAGSFGGGFPPSMSTSVSGQLTNGNYAPTNKNSSENTANSSSTSKSKTPSTAPQMKIRGNEVTAATTNQNPTKKTKRKKATTERETETPPPSTKRGKQPGDHVSPAPDSAPKEKKIPPPKRPLNGFMTFSAEVRPEIVAQFPELSVTELAKKIGERYRELNDEQRQKYVDNARSELIRFKEEHPELVNNPLKKSKSKKKKEKQKKGGDTAGVDSISESARGNKPKRPLNAFMLYASELREKFKAANPELKHPDNMSKISEMYKALDDSSKNQYKAQAEKAKAEFIEEYGEDAMKFGPRSKGKVDELEQEEERDSVERGGGGGGGGDSTGEKRGISTSDKIPAKGLPNGWTTRVVPRKDKSQSDTYWYSPVMLYKFRSMPAVKTFLKLLEESNGDEVRAHVLFQSSGKKLKSTDAAIAAVGDRKKAKKSKTVVAARSDEDISDDDEMPDAWTDC